MGLGRAAIRGQAAGQTFDFTAQITARSDKEALLVTDSDPPHHARVAARYVGDVLSDDETICGFEWDGRYIALAMWRVDRSGVVMITPHDH
jgi:hypothetical protein